MTTVERSNITKEEAFELGKHIDKLQSPTQPLEMSEDEILRLEHLHSKIIGKVLHPEVFAELAARGYEQKGGGKLSASQLKEASDKLLKVLGDSVETLDNGFVIKEPIIKLLKAKQGISPAEISIGFEKEGTIMSIDKINSIVDTLLKLGLLYIAEDGKINITETGTDALHLNMIAMVDKLNAETASGRDLARVESLLNEGLIKIDRKGTCMPTDRAEALKKQVSELNDQRKMSGLPTFDVEVLMRIKESDDDGKPL